MPELPEVETTRRGIAPFLEGHRITGVTVREKRLRQPIPEALPSILTGQPCLAVERRGKYILCRFAHGTLLLHLGMSGSLRICPLDTPPAKHDHLDLIIGDQVLRLRDPRRFGLALWHTGPEAHPLLAALGQEPLETGFDAQWLHRITRGRNTAIKQLLMDSHILVGVGNIYASESLFRARIHPLTPARRLGPKRCAALADAVRATLLAAIEAGGSSLRDFVHSDGSSGYFQQQYFVYGRLGEACRVCDTPIRRLIVGQRSSFYCPHCQRK